MSWRVHFNEHFPGGNNNVNGGLAVRITGDEDISENPPEVYEDVAPAIGVEIFTEFPFVEATLTITRSSDGHEFVEGVDFEENTPDSWTNLAITPGTGIVVHYFIDSSLQGGEIIDLSDYIKTVNGVGPDEAGNVEVEVGASSGLPRECVMAGETVTIGPCEQMPVYQSIRIEGTLVLEGSLIVR